MEFVSTKNMTNEAAPKGRVLVQFIEPRFGNWCIDFTIAYFDNPLDYNNYKEGKGWLMWNNDRIINVLAYCVLPDTISIDFTKINHKELIEKYGSMHPFLGNFSNII